MQPESIAPVILESPWLDALEAAPFLIALFVIIYFWRHGQSGQSFLKKQSDYLDHQRQATDRALDQNRSLEDMIASQYRETNARADRALTQSDEAIRLHAAALSQLSEMNNKLARLVASIERRDDGVSSGPAS